MAKRNFNDDTNEFDDPIKLLKIDNQNVNLGKFMEWCRNEKLTVDSKVECDYMGDNGVIIGLVPCNSIRFKYHISRTSENSWRNCKLVGSKLGKEEDIAYRKSLAIASFQNLNPSSLTRDYIQDVRFKYFNLL